MISILIIAHAPLASALAEVAVHAYPECAASLRALNVHSGDGADAVEAAARELLDQTDSAGTLVFVDVFGATPGNAATRLLDRPDVRVVAGVNVPMLWRTLCYGTADSLDALVVRALVGATQGVMPVTVLKPQNQFQTPTGHDSSNRDDQQ